MSEVEYRMLGRSQFKCVYCSNDATQEAILSTGNLTAIIRCCSDPQCMRRSREMCESTIGNA